MIKGVSFTDQTQELGKPENMTEEECYSLPIKRTTNGEWPAIESVWEIPEEDLKIIIESKRIRLGIIGNGMPPVYIKPEPKE